MAALPQTAASGAAFEGSGWVVQTRLSGLSLVGGALLLALLARGLVQAREVMLWRAGLQAVEGVDVLQMTDSEARNLRLREHWHGSSADRGEHALARWRQAFGAWQEQLAVLRAPPTMTLAVRDQAFQPQLGQQDSFRWQAGPALDEQARDTERSSLAPLQAAVDKLAAVQHEMLTPATPWQTEQVQQRARLLRSHTRLRLATSWVLVLHTMVFAAAVTRCQTMMGSGSSRMPKRP